MCCDGTIFVSGGTAMRILVIGGDRRMDYAAKRLSEEHETMRIGSGGKNEANGRFDAIILPLPLSKNGSDIFAPASDEPLPFDLIEKFAENNTLIFAGGVCEKLSGLCSEKGYKLENYLAHETLTLQNAALTAEAACAMLSQSTDGSLLNSRALITGYGRIARFLSVRLKANGCSVTVAARRSEQRTSAELDGFSSVPIEIMEETLHDYDIIANTVPSALFYEESFRRMKAECIFIELATLPAEPVRSLAEEFGVKYLFASGLPGKYSPKAAGAYIAEDIIRSIKQSDLKK